MRNTTKLKLILQLFSLTLELEGDVQWVGLLRNHSSGAMEVIKAENYSNLIEKCFRFMKRKMKDSEKENLNR